MDIILDKISFSYHDKQVLKDFSLEIKQGDIFCIMGPSGSGKTTLLKIIAGLLPAVSGNVKILNEKFPEISMVFQEDRLCGGLTPVMNIMLGCDRGYYIDGKTKTGLSKNEQTQIICSHLKQVGLLDASYKRVSELSGGMKRRTAIARAVLSAGSMLLMDEPFQGIDETMKKQVILYIKNNLGDRTLVVVTHDETDVDALSGKTVRLQ